MFEEELGFEKFNIFEEFIGLKEQIKGQVVAQQMLASAQEAGVLPPTEEGEEEPDAQ
jgi:hypothetical protein